MSEIKRAVLSCLNKVGGALPARTGLLCSLTLTSFAQDVQAGIIEAINHTHWAINSFAVDGRSGLDIIGAFQSGGGGCCYIAPQRWHPGVSVLVTWETGVAGSKGFPGFSDWPRNLNTAN